MNNVTIVKKFIALICALCLTTGTITPQLVYAEGLSQTEGEVPSIQTEATVQTETAAQLEVSSSEDIARHGEDSGTTEAQANTAAISGQKISSEQKETASSQDTADAATAPTDDVDSIVISPGGENGSGTALEDGIEASDEGQELTAELDESTLAADNDHTDVVDAEGINLAGGIHLADGTYQPYLTGYRLSYLDGNDYKTITSDIVVPVYTTLKMTVNFGGISAQGLLEKGGKLYIEIPSVLSNPTVSSGIIKDDSGNQIATLRAEGQKLILQMDQEILQNTINQEGKDYTYDNGEISFTVTPDPAQIRTDTTQTLKLGNLDITIHFDPDFDAKAGSLTLEKSGPVYSHNDTDGHSYLSYTLTVSAGDVRMPEVTVTDHFSRGAAAVDSYVGITETDTVLTSDSTQKFYEEIASAATDTSAKTNGSVKLSAARTDTDPGTMVWTIGDMAADETRVLHYQVMLKDDYVGAAGSADTIINTATPKSKTYEHNTATSTFTPQTKASVTKKAGDVRDNSDNTITIPYTFTVTADAKNTWPVKHLKISDDFGLSGTDITSANVWNAITATDAFPSLGFRNFQILNENQTWSAVSAGTKDSPDPYYAIKQNDGRENPGFNFYFGEIKPGQTVQMKCELTMKPVFSSSAVTVNNRGTAYSSDRSSFGNKSLGTSAVSTQLEKYTWDRKVQGAAIDSVIDQSGLTSVYTYSNSAWSLASSAADREVPAGSIKYRVVVNEKGSWDVSSAAFSDVLGQYLQYAGYLRLDYYQSGISSDVSGKTDAEVADALSGQTPDKTVWLDINGMTRFNLSPKSLSSELGQGAYLLTYYAAPVAGNFSRATSGNSFTLSGSIVGTGGVTYSLPSMNVKTSTTVSGSLDYSVKKEGWYYDSKDTAGNFTYGKLYWVITVSGSKIPAGVQFQDSPGNQPQHATTDSIAGIFIGDAVADDSSITDKYEYYSQIKDNPLFIRVNQAAYGWDLTKYQGRLTGGGILTFNKDITIPDGKKMYIILMTTPNKSGGQREQRAFYNSLLEKGPGQHSFENVNTASLFTLGEGTNFKEPGSYGAYDSTTGTWSYVPQSMITSGNNPKDKILTSYQSGERTVSLSSGTYAEYRLVVNYGGDEQGSFRVEDVVPDGMEPVYIRCFWIPKEIRTDPSQTPTMTEITDLGGDWTDIGLKETKIDRSNYAFNAYAYYSAENHKILFDVGNLHKGIIDKADIQVQVVMRVTDPEALMGKRETFVNTMNVYRPDGSLVSTSSVSTEIQIPSIEKSAADVSEGAVPFTITVNPRGEDLLPGSDTLTLVDEMTGSFTIDPGSVTVKDSSGAALDGSQWNISLQKGKNSSNQPVTTMTLALPDSQKLTVTYKAEIDAAPDTGVTYSNKAYWQGYQEQSATTITGTVKYSIDGSISMSNYPEIRLVKVDQSNASKELSGAKFSLYLAAYDQGTGKWSKTGKPLDIQTTASSGTHSGILTFGESKNLLYNTVYCIVEDRAPDGYVKSTDPVFIVMARKDSSGGYPDKSTAWGSTDTSGATVHTADELKTWATQGVIVNYRGSVYTYTAANQKASLKIDKAFLNSDGSKAAAPSDGTFAFGLYNSLDRKVGTLTIRYQNGTPAYTLTQNGISQSVTEPVFQSLNVGDLYKVYELDGDGDPITDGRLLYNKEGNGYIVRYQGVSGSSDSDTAAGTGGDANTVTAPDSTEPAVFCVMNQEFKIPATGVETDSTRLYRVAVWLLAFAAAVFVILAWRGRIRRKW
ncbi:MAG: SpaA isopeptide-forming pilin-related protein [Lachnospiraceae bacterium]|nr:SpaA isopeptide-forming pilin-related protein [Lachnospiraceae bacterium]